MIRVTITRTDVGEWTGEHKRPSAAYARALVQAYPNPTIEPRELREQWLSAIGEWKDSPRMYGIECTRVTSSDRAQSVHVMIERA